MYAVKIECKIALLPTHLKKSGGKYEPPPLLEKNSINEKGEVEKKRDKVENIRKRERGGVKGKIKKNTHFFTRVREDSCIGQGEW